MSTGNFKTFKKAAVDAKKLPFTGSFCLLLLEQLRHTVPNDVDLIS